MKETSIGHGIAWAGFWIMIGLINFGETKLEVSFSNETELVKIIKMFKLDEQKKPEAE